MSGSVRIGAVAYLNSKPLIEGIEQLAPQCKLSLAVPSQLADQLASKQLDIALIPVIEYFQLLFIFNFSTMIFLFKLIVFIFLQIIFKCFK